MTITNLIKNYPIIEALVSALALFGVLCVIN